MKMLTYVNSSRLSEAMVARTMASRRIFLAPSHIFSPDGTSSTPAMRINLARSTDPAFFAFLSGHLDLG